MTIDRVAPQSPSWPARVRALTTTKPSPDRERSTAAGGSRSGDRSQAFSARSRAFSGSRRSLPADRQALQERLGLAQLQWLTQVHGSRSVEARDDSVDTSPEADAAWTRQPNLGLAVVTADCVPVVICDRAATVVAVAHGGWRGLVGGVLENLVAALPAHPEDLVAWLGPAIGPSAYEVGEDVAGAVARLPRGRELAAACLRPAAAAGKHYLDLFTLSEGLLRNAGVGKVTSERLCTFSDRRFYSFRRDGSTGRMATLAWLTGSSPG